MSWCWTNPPTTSIWKRSRLSSKGSGTTTGRSSSFPTIAGSSPSSLSGSSRSPPDAVRDYEGTYDEYVAYCGDDHLDTEATLRKAKQKDRRKKGQPASSAEKKMIRTLEKKRDELTEKIETAEERVHEINDLFCDPSYFDRTPHKDVRRLETEQKTLKESASQLLEQWEEVEN